MHIVSPLSQCVSLEKRDKFLKYIRSIAPVTLSTEPNCHGYAWFRSADDNDVVPSHWLRGFEIYSSKEASHVEHRASEEYKAFRKAVGEEGLLGRPSDLQFWHPTGVGFLTKGTPATFDARSDGAQYIVTDEFKAAPGKKNSIIDSLRNVAEIAQKNDDVYSFWVLGRVGSDGSVAPEVNEDSLYVFIRFRHRKAFDEFSTEAAAAYLDSLGEKCSDRRKTTWIESGIGFLGR